MDGILSTSQIDQLAAFRVLAAPNIREDLLATVDHLLDVKKQSDDAAAELRAQEATNAAALEEANQKLMAAQKMAAETADEVRRFAEVRAAVEQQHRDHDAASAQCADALSQRERAIEQREAELADREVAVGNLMKKNTDEGQRLAERHGRLDAMIREINAGAATIAAAIAKVD